MTHAERLVNAVNIAHVSDGFNITQAVLNLSELGINVTEATQEVKELVLNSGSLIIPEGEFSVIPEAGNLYYISDEEFFMSLYSHPSVYELDVPVNGVIKFKDLGLMFFTYCPITSTVTPVDIPSSISDVVS
jgi:hypothetical protein